MRGKVGEEAEMRHDTMDNRVSQLAAALVARWKISAREGKRRKKRKEKNMLVQMQKKSVRAKSRLPVQRDPIQVERNQHSLRTVPTVKSGWISKMKRNNGPTRSAPSMHRPKKKRKTPFAIAGLVSSNVNK